MTVEFTPWSSQFADMAVWHTTDKVLAEDAMNTAISADEDDETEFQVGMTELFTLRAKIFNHPNITNIAKGSAFIEQQTQCATWIDVDRAWPTDPARAALTLWKAGRL